VGDKVEEDKQRVDGDMEKVDKLMILVGMNDREMVVGRPRVAAGSLSVVVGKELKMVVVGSELQASVVVVHSRLRTVVPAVLRMVELMVRRFLEVYLNWRLRNAI